MGGSKHYDAVIRHDHWQKGGFVRTPRTPPGYTLVMNDIWGSLAEALAVLFPHHLCTVLMSSGIAGAKLFTESRINFSKF